MPPSDYDIIIVGTGPAGLGAAFHLSEHAPSLSILMIDREKVCSGGLLNDCKQNYTYPIGFSTENSERLQAELHLPHRFQHRKLDQGRGRTSSSSGRELPETGYHE